MREFRQKHIETIGITQNAVPENGRLYSTLPQGFTENPQNDTETDNRQSK